MYMYIHAFVSSRLTRLQLSFGRESYFSWTASGLHRKRVIRSTILRGFGDQVEVAEVARMGHCGVCIVETPLIISK